jgi:two-component system sensor kinase FixL
MALLIRQRRFFRGRAAPEGGGVMILVDDVVVAAALITFLALSRYFRRGRAVQTPPLPLSLPHARDAGAAHRPVLAPGAHGDATWRRRGRGGRKHARTGNADRASAGLAPSGKLPSDALFHGALERLPVAALVADRHGRIMVANAAAVKLFGYSRDELIGAPVDMLVCTARGDSPSSPSGNVGAAWPVYPAEHSCDRIARCKDGVAFAPEITMVPLCSARASDTLTIVMDRTERQELLRIRQELVHLSRVSTLGELAGALAHELNQPLTAILSNAQAAQRFMATQPVNLAEVREILEDLVNDNHRASEILRRIRVLVKKEAPEPAPLRLDGVVADVVRMVHGDALRRGISLTLDIAPGLPWVHGERVQLQQVLLNVLLNSFEAVEACPVEDRVVMIGAALDGPTMIRVAVRDRGPGLAPDKLDKLFSPYFTSKRDGLGLGLSISRSIVQGHGGRIWAENNEQQGATFYFTLPTVTDPRYAPARSEP